MSNPRFIRSIYISARRWDGGREGGKEKLSQLPVNSSYRKDVFQIRAERIPQNGKM
jgi:hypothetical protein